MDLIGPEIRLEPQGGKVEFIRADWVHNAPWPIMHHKPTHASFCIVLPPPDPEGRASIYDIVARSSHVCEGNAVPHPAELQALGRAAIVVFLLEHGIWPEEVLGLDDDIPF